MSVQVIVPSPQLISASPVYVCPNNALAAFQQSSAVIVNRNANSGFSQQNPTLWSFYWNSLSQDVSQKVNKQGYLYC